MKRNWILLSGALGLLIVGGLLATAENRPRPSPPPRSGGGESSQVAATGRIEAWRQATVRFRAPGRVARYLKKEGEWAKAGEPVVELDQSVEKAALEQAEAELFQASSRRDRYQKLKGTPSVSPQELDDVEAGYKLALAKRDQARAALDERTLRAPFDGRVLKTYLEAGDGASAGSDQPLFVLGDTRRLKVVAEVDELDVGRVSVGDAARISPDAMPELELSGRVVRASGMLGRKTVGSDDPRDRVGAKVLEVEIELAPDARLKPGMTVQAKLQKVGDS